MILLSVKQPKGKMMEEKKKLVNILEAILFVAGDPVNIEDLTQNLNLTELEILHAADQLESRYESQNSGIVLKRFGNHLQLGTRSDYAVYIEDMLQPVQRQSLSRSALETLAIIAYRQPTTRLDIEKIRGVKSNYSVQSLLAKNLIEEVGRRDTIGRPILYGTTDQFLSHFGITSLSELPDLPDIPSMDKQIETTSED
jgi:segregation and condensation protein B